MQEYGNMNNHPLKSPKKMLTQEGFSLVEILIAIAVLSIGMLGIAAMQTSAIKGNSKANDLTQRTLLASNHIEYLLNIPFTHSDLTDTAGTPRVLVVGEYTYSWTVTDSPAATPTEKSISLTLNNNRFGTQNEIIIETKRLR